MQASREIVTTSVEYSAEHIVPTVAAAHEDEHHARQRVFIDELPEVLGKHGLPTHRDDETREEAQLENLCHGDPKIARVKGASSELELWELVMQRTSIIFVRLPIPVFGVWKRYEKDGKTTRPVGPSE